MHQPDVSSKNILIPLSELVYDEIFMHGKQSTLLSSVRRKSKTIKATKAVT